MMSDSLPIEPGFDLDRLRQAIQEEYAAVARDPGRGYHFHTGRPLASMLGYHDEWLEGLPEGSIASFAGTGNGFVAEFIVGWRLPFGIIGALIAALVGIWIVTNVVILIIPGDPVLFGIPLFKALIGATLFAALWSLLTYRLWHHRRPYYQRRVPA
jgi:uncharacterized membrane protein YeaQ/YmgE (transglycosylase-associated protein family)